MALLKAQSTFVATVSTNSLQSDAKISFRGLPSSCNISTLVSTSRFIFSTPVFKPKKSLLILATSIFTAFSIPVNSSGKFSTIWRLSSFDSSVDWTKKSKIVVFLSCDLVCISFIREFSLNPAAPPLWVPLFIKLPMLRTFSRTDISFFDCFTFLHTSDRSWILRASSLALSLKLSLKR